MKDDTISRREAIDAIVNTVSHIGLHDNSEVARYGATFRQHEIIDIVENLPSAQQWIPCSERQPEETNLYWVTIIVQNSEKLEATQRWYFGRGYGDGWAAELYEPPLAWMPMEWPEPWRGEEDE